MRPERNYIYIVRVLTNKNTNNMEKIFETKNGSVLYYDGIQRKLYARNCTIQDIMESLEEDAESTDIVSSMMAKDLLEDIALLGGIRTLSGLRLN